MDSYYKLTLLTSQEFKQEIIGDFNFSISDNRIVLLGGYGDASACVLSEPITENNFPFALSMIPVPQERPCTKLIRNINLSVVYDNSDILESQELAIDRIYTAECSIDPPKYKIIQANWAPNSLLMPYKSILAVLNNYGTLHIRQIHKLRRTWEETIYNFNKIFTHNDSESKLDASEIKSIKELKNFIDIHWITAFAWYDCSNSNETNSIIIIGNAAGSIAICRMSVDYKDAQVLIRFKSKIANISYIKQMNNLLLISGSDGMVQLFKITHDFQSIVEADFLWSKKDRLSCRSAEMIYNKVNKTYYIVYTKSAHVLAYLVNEDGIMITSTTLYVGGIKISGLVSMLDNKFLITTITGQIYYLNLQETDNELKLIEENVNTTFLKPEYQILGLATTKNCSFFTLMLNRNKEYTLASKYHHTSSLISICNLNTNRNMKRLCNIKIPYMDIYEDSITAITMEIQQKFKGEYEDFCNLITINKDVEDKDLLQQLQLKYFALHIATKYKLSNMMTYRERADFQVIVLKSLLILQHIIIRLKYLKSLKILNEFQKDSAHMMYLKFKQQSDKLLKYEKSEFLTDAEKKVILKFNTIITKEFDVMKEFEMNDSKEKCLECDAIIDKNTFMCAEEHHLRRCCITFKQVSFDTRLYCSRCNYAVCSDEENLAQLFDTDEVVNCTFCRFKFKINENNG